MGRSYDLRDDQYIGGSRRLSGILCRVIVATVILTSLSVQGHAQEFLTRSGTVAVVDDGCDIDHLAPCFKRVAQDEVGMTRSIFHIKRSSLPAILGIAAATGVSLQFDKQMSKTLTSLPVHPKPFGREADFAGVYGPFGIAGLLYMTGSVIHNDRVRETGILATEAMIDAALMGKALKFVTNRQAPGVGPQSFDFYATGIQRGGSMPSSHALNAWSFARVIAGESHSKWISILAYTAASSVSFSRALTGAHSVSDVIVGSALGYGIGEYVLRKRSTKRSVPMSHLAASQGDLAMVQRHEELLQPEESPKSVELAGTEEILGQGDGSQSISEEQPTAVDSDSSADSPS